MRGAMTPRQTCGERHALLLRWLAVGAACVSACLIAITPAAAQENSINLPKPPSVFGSAPKLDKTQPLYLQGDQLIYDTKGNRVVARGNVEIYYNNNVLRADEVIYDQSANTLSASGNVELREAGGNIIRAERYDITDDFRDGFVQSLSVVTKDDETITATRGTRREGNVTEFPAPNIRLVRASRDSPRCGASRHAR